MATTTRTDIRCIATSRLLGQISLQKHLGLQDDIEREASSRRMNDSDKVIISMESMLDMDVQLVAW